MSKRKTRNEKKRSQLRKQQNSELSLNNQNVNQNYAYKIKPTLIKEIDEDEILVTDPKYIKNDLLKTLILSLIFFGLLLGLFYMNQNNFIKF